VPEEINLLKGNKRRVRQIRWKRPEIVRVVLVLVVVIETICVALWLITHSFDEQSVWLFFAVAQSQQPVPTGEEGTSLRSVAPERSRIVKEIKAGDHVVVDATKMGDHLAAAEV
jgi:hypothetical protein